MFGVLRQVTFLFSSFRRLVAARFARGYTIVEMAIALAVLGLLFAGALYPWQNRVESDQRREVESLLDSARLAVVAYAARNRTRAASFQPQGGGPVDQIPAGRPYLPCPDITGDGVEDRARLDEVSNFGNFRNPFVRDDIVGRTTTVGIGACRRHKGMLPWATLGVAENDVWGGRFTYRVDPAFSSQLLGFDETTRADIYDFRDLCPLTISHPDSFSRRDRGEGCFTPRANLPMPSLICDAVPCNLTTATPHRQHSYRLGRHGAGQYLSFQLRAERYHRRRGFRHPFARPEQSRRFQSPWRGFLQQFSRWRERANPINANAPPAQFVTDFNDSCDLANDDDHFFVSHPRTRGGANDFDDIVIWASANEIIGQMAALGVMPIAALPGWPR